MRNVLYITIFISNCNVSSSLYFEFFSTAALTDVNFQLLLLFVMLPVKGIVSTQCYKWKLCKRSRHTQAGLRWEKLAWWYIFFCEFPLNKIMSKPIKIAAARSGLSWGNFPCLAVATEGSLKRCGKRTTYFFQKSVPYISFTLTVDHFFKSADCPFSSYDITVCVRFLGVSENFRLWRSE